MMLKCEATQMIEDLLSNSILNSLRIRCAMKIKLITTNSNHFVYLFKIVYPSNWKLLLEAK